MNLFQRALNRLKAAAEKFTSIIPLPKPATPSAPYLPEAGTGGVRAKVLKAAESEAERRAMDIIKESGLHPEDKTYDLARRKAVEYLTRAGKLSGGGSLQRANRYNIAKRYIDNDLSTSEGISERKRKKREVFSANFNLNLSDSQYDTMDKIMASNSYNKLMELHREKYDIIITMAADAIEKGVDAKRVQKALDFWEKAYLDPDFDAFAQVVDLDRESWNEMMDRFEEESKTIAWERGDDLERRELSEAILGRYIKW